MWTLAGCCAVLLIGMAVLAHRQDEVRISHIQTGPNPYFFHDLTNDTLRQARPSVLPLSQLEELCSHARALGFPLRECPNCCWEFWLIGQPDGIFMDMKCMNCGEPITVDTTSERQKACETQGTSATV